MATKTVIKRKTRDHSAIRIEADVFHKLQSFCRKNGYMLSKLASRILRDWIMGGKGRAA